MRNLFVLLIAFFIFSCNKDKQPNITFVVVQGDTTHHPTCTCDTPQHPPYPYHYYYNGIMQVQSMHTNFNNWKIFLFDTVIQNPPMGIEFLSADSIKISFGYWDCVSALDSDKRYYDVLRQKLKVTNNNIYYLDEKGNNRVYYDSLRKDSLFIQTTNDTGPDYGQRIYFVGQRRR